jgi:riboflavin-specific deaminase-like protein
MPPPTENRPSKARPAPSSRPRVSANFAITADGRISTRSLTPSDFSSPADKRRLLELRADVDAVIASARTVGADGMTMGLPPEDLRSKRLAAGMSEYPLRVLLSNSGRIPQGLRVFEVGFSDILLFSTEQMPAATRRRLAVIPFVRLHLHSGRTVDIAAMLRTLRTEYGVRHAMCEGGGQIFRAFAEQGFLNRLNLTVCPRVFGGLAAPTLTGVSKIPFPASTRLRLESMERCGDELFLRYTVLRDRTASALRA